MMETSILGLPISTWATLIGGIVGIGAVSSKMMTNDAIMRRDIDRMEKDLAATSDEVSNLRAEIRDDNRRIFERLDAMSADLVEVKTLCKERGGACEHGHNR